MVKGVNLFLVFVSLGLADIGHEFEKCDDLGWISRSVRKLNAMDLSLPHVGWNDITITQNHQILINLKTSVILCSKLCFDVDNKSNVIAHTDYGEVFNTIVVEQYIPVQFHPEKSQELDSCYLITL